MKSVKNKGFVLIVVIVAIALLGAELFILSGASNTILFQTNSTFLKAVEQNLVSSGLAWTEANIRNKTIKNPDNMIELDITDMGVKRAFLNVKVEKCRGREQEVEITASSSRGRQSFTHNKKYRVRL